MVHKISNDSNPIANPNTAENKIKASYKILNPRSIEKTAIDLFDQTISKPERDVCDCDYECGPMCTLDFVCSSECCEND